MPSVSQAQHGFAAMSTSEVGRAKLRRAGKKPMPGAVAHEFLHADSGRKISTLAKHARKK
jgi:hypothetical protein